MADDVMLTVEELMSTVNATYATATIQKFKAWADMQDSWWDMYTADPEHRLADAKCMLAKDCGVPPGRARESVEFCYKALTAGNSFKPPVPTAATMSFTNADESDSKDNLSSRAPAVNAEPDAKILWPLTKREGLVEQVVVGTKISLYWPQTNTWYEGEVAEDYKDGAFQIPFPEDDPTEGPLAYELVNYNFKILGQPYDNSCNTTTKRPKARAAPR